MDSGKKTQKRKCEICKKKKVCRWVHTFLQEVSSKHGSMTFSTNWLCYECENDGKRFAILDICEDENCTDCNDFY